ncbi:HEAT repeat domain-containing protein [Mesobacillus subterraneus]|uniref:HEAT repeat domain-containing protein n=1 Tax=Mesobacillus subterraneus TaxID=285983 RepID=UPI00203DC02E|nr:HEAT repeat domain-containing protein [Mesobacillus subterraneus]MCM3662814.1 HEAT repeat domain-containing protein [Mesobacillus subterraneus]MCM3683010.1 HEAT repeat domain-containing protein [Mesobacillus subterraneus]
MIRDEIQFLVTAFTVLSAILIVMLFYLIGRKAAENRLRKRVEGLKRSMNEKMLHSILTGDFLRSLQTDTKVKKLAMEELLSHYAELLEGTEEKVNLNRLAESRLGSHYRKNLRSLKWSTRMNALFHIEAFRMDGLKDEVFRMLERRRVTKEEKLRTLTILSQFQSREMFELLTVKYCGLSYLEFRNILSRLDSGGFDLFVLGYHSCPLELKFAILDLVGMKKDLKYLSFAESVFSASSGEERVRALKALSSIGHVRKLERYLPLFESGNWQERMLTARLAGAMKAEAVLPNLVKLLQDPSWWVRSQAGQAITMFPQGKNILQGVMDETSDTFARDMAWEWINKGVNQS